VLEGFHLPVPVRDRLEECAGRAGPWQAQWKRRRRYSGDGATDSIPAALPGEAEKFAPIGWALSADSAIVQAHQHAAEPAPRPGPSCVPLPPDLRL